MTTMRTIEKIIVTPLQEGICFTAICSDSTVHSRISWFDGRETEWSKHPDIPKGE